MALPRKVNGDLPEGSSVCAACPLYELNLCAAALKMTQSEAKLHPGASRFTSFTRTIPARRTIFHPKEWSDYVIIICSGRATSSIALPDGRRQILSFLLPGDTVFAADLFEPMSGYAVEAITEVTYRQFKRGDLKKLLFEYSDIMEMITKIWREETMRANQLALDLGRRNASERIARLILSLAERLARRGMMRDQTMDFPLRQRHIADATGLTPVHVSKLLGEFQRAGMVEIRGRSLTIVNAAELRQVAGPA